MTSVGEKEARTQRRVVALFRDNLGFRYLGDWRDRDSNRNVESQILASFLKRGCNSANLIAKATAKLERTAALGGSRTLFEANREVYSLLRYGARVSPRVGEKTVTVDLINWSNPSG